MPISTFPRHDDYEDQFLLKPAGLRDTHSEGKVTAVVILGVLVAVGELAYVASQRGSEQTSIPPSDRSVDYASLYARPSSEASSTTSSEVQSSYSAPVSSQREPANDAAKTSRSLRPRGQGIDQAGGGSKDASRSRASDPTIPDPPKQTQPDFTEESSTQARNSTDGAAMNRRADAFLNRNQYEEAAAWYAMACADAIGDACDHLGLMYESGEGVARDYSAAARSYSKACKESDAQGCVLLGALYLSGLGVDRDQKTALSLFRRACELGSQVGCKDEDNY